MANAGSFGHCQMSPSVPIPLVTWKACEAPPDVHGESVSPPSGKSIRNPWPVRSGALQPRVSAALVISRNTLMIIPAPCWASSLLGSGWRCERVSFEDKTSVKTVASAVV